jgi:hypothetical protein
MTDFIFDTIGKRLSKAQIMTVNSIIFMHWFSLIGILIK